MSLGVKSFCVAAAGLVPAALVALGATGVASPWLRAGLAVSAALLAAAIVARRTVRQVADRVEEFAEAASRVAAGEPLGRSVPSSILGRTSRETRQLEHAVHQLVAAVEATQRDRERSYVEAIGAVVAAVDARDHETSGHSLRVARYAVALARTLGVEDRDRLRAIEWGGLLHDVGKIAVPDAVLRKVGPLTEDEWHIMRQHPSWGYEILADVQFLKPALAIVYSHHERWDGGGYPRGLAHDQIPLTARVFAVVDTYDAITSDRPYRRGRSHSAALSELRRVAASQLDPELVEAFASVGELELRRLREDSAGKPLDLPVPLEPDTGDIVVPVVSFPQRL